MSIVSGIVLYAVIWFMTFLVALPIRVTTQGEAGEIVPGTHSGAPDQHHLKRKAVVTTIVAGGLWLVVVGTILFGDLSVRDLPWAR